jgi:hypothetical protein
LVPIFFCHRGVNFEQWGWFLVRFNAVSFFWKMFDDDLWFKLKFGGDFK